MFESSLFGRFSFTHAGPVLAPLTPGHHHLGIASDRDAVLYVPSGVDPGDSLPLWVMFHGAGGFPEKVLPFVEDHAQRNKFLILAPYSIYPTWDIVIGGNGPDLERLQRALLAVATRFRIDRNHLAFAGFSDGASYALSIGITNGDFVSHVIAFSGGFMSIFMQTGAPKIFIAHGLADEQLPIATSGRANAAKLKTAGYDVQYIEFDGRHAVQPAIVAKAVDFFLK